MHELILSGNGWEVEHLRDDSDHQKELYISSALDSKLAGCSFIEEVKQDQHHSAKIRYEEHFHNEKISVEAVVYTTNGNGHKGKKTLQDALFLEQEEFEGEDCKQKAAHYAHNLKSRIDQSYFSSGT